MIVPKLRFSEFKSEWQIEKLGDLVTIKSGYSPSKYDLKSFGEIPFLKVDELNNCDKYQEKSRFYSDSNKDMISKDSVIFPKRGAAILNNKVRILKVPALLDSNLMALTFNPKQNPEFYYYLINKIELFKIADTSTIPQINNKHIEPYEVFTTTNEEQTKIAEFLSAVDDKISQLSRQLELLNQYKKGVMQKIFSQEIRFKNDNGEDFGEWEEIQLKDFLTLTLRPVDKPNENYHALGVRSHFKGLFNKYDSQPEKNSMDVLYEVFENDIVVNITFAWEGAMAIANKIHHKGLVSHRFPTYQTDESKILLNFFR